MPLKANLPCPILCYEELLDAQLGEGVVPRWPLVVNEHAACGLCYTSGTTGAPKGVLYSHRSNVLHSAAFIQTDCL